MGDRTRMERQAGDAGDLQTQQDTSVDQGQRTTFTGAGFIPPFMAFPQGGVQAKSASDIAFGVGPDGPKHDHPMPQHMDEAALRARMQKSEAERLLKTKDVTSPQDAVQALEILLTVEPTQLTKVVDELDDKAFENLIDRLPWEQQERLTLLVDASQKPKRKLQLWQVQHMARARHDLQRYEGDFGPEDDRTPEQDQKKAKYDRRKRGVDSTQKEVTAESKKLTNKGDKLTVADIDAMRARKDQELEVEIKHNINLIAQDGPRYEKGDDIPPKVDQANPDVVWSQRELTQLDYALDKIPDEHAHGAESNETYVRRANDPWMDSRSGQYDSATDDKDTKINIFDHADVEDMTARGYVGSVEYSTVHEIGHDVERDNKEAFEKFEKAAGWKTVHRADLEKEGFSEKDLENANGGKHARGKQIHKVEGRDIYNEVDDTAIPSQANGDPTERWKYSIGNSDEHFAEMYAAAVENPQQLYNDYVQSPADNLKGLVNKVRDQQRAVDGANSADRPHLAAILATTKKDLATAEKIVKQRREMFDIIRNDIFHAEKGVAAAVARLRQKGVGTDAIRYFSAKAAKVSTPKQIEELENEAMKK